MGFLFFGFLALIDRALISFLRLSSEEFISIDSYKVAPVAPVFLCFSEPARSTSKNLLLIVFRVF